VIGFWTPHVHTSMNTACVCSIIMNHMESRERIAHGYMDATWLHC